MIFRALDSLILRFIRCRTRVGLKKMTKDAKIRPTRANIRRTACHVKQPRRLLVKIPTNPEATVKPPTTIKSHPILLGACSSAQMITMPAIPPMVARRFKIERRPVDTNANCPLIDLPAMIPDFPSNFTLLFELKPPVARVKLDLDPPKKQESQERRAPNLFTDCQ